MALVLTPHRRLIVVMLLAGSVVGAGQDSAVPAPSEASALLARGAYAEAERSARATLQMLDASGAGESLAAADVLDLLVSTGLRLGKERSGDTKALAERALAIRRRMQGDDHPATAASMVGLANVLRRQRAFATAQPLYEQALTIREKAFGPVSLEVADSINGLANLLYDSGSFAMAQPLYEQVVGIREKVLGLEHPDTGDAVGNLANTRRNLGDFGAARGGFERALGIFERAFGPEHSRVASTLNNLALVLKNSGDWNGARRCWERALPIFEREMGASHPYVAGMLNNLGDLARKVGDLEEARSLFERSLAIRERALGPDHPEVAQSLNNLGIVLVDQGRPMTARPLLERSLAIREKALGATHPDVAMSLNNLGEVLGQLGELAGARAAHERALAIRAKALGDDHPFVAESLHNLALVSLAAGDPLAAEQPVRRALAIWAASFGEVHPHWAQASITLARVLAARGEISAALDAALRGEEAARRHLGLTVVRLSESEALHYAAVRTSGRDLALDLLSRSGSTPAERRRVWEAVVRARGVVLETLVERRLALREKGTGDRAGLRSELDDATEDLARLLVGGPGRESLAQHRARIDAAMRRLEGAERVLAERSVTSGARFSREQLTLESIAAALPAASALVSFVRMSADPAGVPVPAPSGTTARPAGRYLALVLRSGAADVAVVPLAAATRVDEGVRLWLAEAARGALVPDRSPTDALLAYRVAARALRREIWDPLVPALAGVRLVLLVPDGALHLVNWGTLPVGSDRYLVEGEVTLHRLTAEREVVLLTRSEGRGRGLLAIGGPDFGPVSPGTAPGAGGGVDCPQLQDVGFAALPGAAREVEDVATVWRRTHAAGEETGDDAVVLTGDAATEAAFKARAAGRRILHVATHAFARGAFCAPAEAGLRGVGGLSGSLSALGATEGGEGVSGLAFAGANRRAEATLEEDGILTSQEIAVLDFGGADWAVLSACDTGVGELHASEGLLGLQRAFRSAGVRSVVVSLWPVDDQATREWMDALYRTRLDGRASTADAVRLASRRMLAERRSRFTSHPFVWGAFVATGDWR